MWPILPLRLVHGTFVALYSCSLRLEVPQVTWLDQDEIFQRVLLELALDVHYVPGKEGRKERKNGYSVLIAQNLLDNFLVPAFT